tara:strand:- start:351 stop:2087 length:1737 start_codon:yes stop_codon:yes gene_type:complete
MAGVNFREQTKLVNKLKQAGKIEPASTAPADWRIPKVGPVFEGRPLPDGARTPQLFTPTDVADALESSYGSRLQWFVGGKNILPEIRKWSNRFKVTKLFGSAFQHLDFATRLFGPLLAPSSIARGTPRLGPSLAYRLFKDSVSESARTALRRDLLSNKPIFKDSPITHRMLIEEGWGVHGDITLIQREASQFIDDAIKERGLTGKPLEAAQKMSKFFTSGLFKGVYRESQKFSLENFIIPSIRKQHPDWTPRQVAANAAEVVNIQFSTLASWQTVVKSPHMKEFLYNVIFSANESESLIRQAVGIVKGPNKRLWAEHHAGMVLGIAMVANIINYSATGKPLPASSYSPIDLGDQYGSLKFGYNGRFMSPAIPGLKSKTGGPVYLDLVGQMDTVFRWAINPVNAVASRLNVIPRAVTNQVVGKTFFGEDLGGLGEPSKWPIRAIAAASDVLAPIPVTAGLAAAQSAIPQLEGIVPTGERRLDATGQAIQAIGLNLRGSPLTDQFPKTQDYWELKTSKERRNFRKANPEVDAVLYIEGRFTSLLTSAAERILFELIKENDIDPRFIKGYAEDYGNRRRVP